MWRYIVQPNTIGSVNGGASMSDLPILQKLYDLIIWFIPILNGLPKSHKFNLGNRIITSLYDLLDGLITARYMTEKRAHLQALNTQLDILRYQTRLLLDFHLIDAKRYEYAGRQINAIGSELGGWIKQQQASLSKPITKHELAHA